MSTALLGLYAPADGADAGTWGSSWNTQGSGYLDTIIAGITTLSLSSTNVALTAAQARSQMLRLTGTLLAAVTISPDTGVLWNGIRCIENLTTGNFTITLQNSGGSVAIPQNRRGLLYLDTVNGPRFVSMASTTNADTIPANNPMTFFVASAPTGWTQVTTYNDYALRLVGSAGGSTGGSVNFSTLFGRTAVDGHALTVAELAPHTHDYVNQSANVGNSNGVPGNAGNSITSTTTSTGSGDAHIHNIDMRVKYADLIIAQHA